ncbi:MAG: STAS domain-containing protein [Candidatus Accumulibacter sp.]|jgi:phospholipid transport system transporter-binding protein|nr:STAS domain-containing protein [Accumulibacter sp.]
MIDRNGKVYRVVSPMVVANARALLEAGRGLLDVETEGEARLDLASVREADSSALAVLFALRRAAAARGRTLSVIHPPPGLISLAGLYGVAESLPLA